MAITDMHKFTVQEKLNKMDVDVITITTASVTSDASGKMAILPTEIPNAVAVKGGTSLLQTCLVYNPSGNDLPLDIFISDTISGFSSASVGTTIDGADLCPGTLADNDSNVATIMEGVQCVFNTGTGIDVGSGDTVNYVGSIGAPVKAASDSTSLYLWAIARSSGDPDAALKIKLGFVKD